MTKEVEKIFEEDVLQPGREESLKSPEALLQSDGLFYLKDVARVLDLDPVKLRILARRLQQEGQSWEVLGARKAFKHWMIRMRTFATYYRENLRPNYRKVKEEWDTNTLLAQPGVFLLSQVCKHLPFSVLQMRYQANRIEDPRQKIGIWQDEISKNYLVEMEVFSQWIKRVWDGSFESDHQPPPPNRNRAKKPRKKATKSKQVTKSVKAAKLRKID